MAEITPFLLAQRYVGIQEIAGDEDHPLIRWWLSLCGFKTTVHDEVPWCSAFVNGICWELRLPRSKSAAARSWLNIGYEVATPEAQVGSDIVVLSRGTNPAQGHVGFFAGLPGPGLISVLGGNQSNGVCVQNFSLSRVLSVRRL